MTKELDHETWLASRENGRKISAASDKHNAMSDLEAASLKAGAYAIDPELKEALLLINQWASTEQQAASAELERLISHPATVAYRSYVEAYEKERG